MRLALAAAATMLAASSAVAAPQCPAIYRGVWITIGEKPAGGAGAPSCKASDFDQHTDPDLISVKPSSVSYWESGCDLVSLARTDTGTLNLSMSCGGEGLSEKSKEIWTLRKVRGADTLVMAIPRRSTITLLQRCP